MYSYKTIYKKKKTVCENILKRLLRNFKRSVNNIILAHW